jgi:hypothetical protein
MRKIVIDAEPPWELWGTYLGGVDNERSSKPRWAELRLYQYLDTDPSHHSANPSLNTYGQVLYLLYTLGHSAAFHWADGECNRGIAVPVEEFSHRAEFPVDELEPCQICRPPALADVEPGTVLGLEILRHTFFKCRDAEALIERLKRPSKETCDQCHGRKVYPPMTRQQCGECRGRGYVDGELVISAPGARLLALVKDKDPEIARAMRTKVQL